VTRPAVLGTVSTMNTAVELKPEGIEIVFPGAKPLITMKRQILLPWAEVASARVDDQRTLKKDIGIRIAGGYWPGWFATGHFTYRHRRGERQFWCAYRAERLLVIETTKPRPRRIVVQVDDPDAVAAAISTAHRTRIRT
jgi:hypothetical protein